MYELGKSLWEAAYEYNRDAQSMAERENYGRLLSVSIELAIECYLKGIIEISAQKDVDTLYGKSKVPHELDKLYKDAVNYSSNAFKFEATTLRELKGAFKDYNARRFPKKDVYVDIDENAILFDLELMKDIEYKTKDFAKDYSLQNNEFIDIQDYFNI